MPSVTVKMHKLKKNMEQRLLLGFHTMYTCIDYGKTNNTLEYEMHVTKRHKFSNLFMKSFGETIQDRFH